MGKKKNKKDRPLTQDEIWDDSALIRSWDEAVEEYNLYHSIHARGENIEEVLAAAESNETTAGGTALSGVATENGNLNLQERNSDLPEDMAFEKGEINDRDMSQDLDLSRAAPPDSSPTKPSPPTLTDPQIQPPGNADSGPAAALHEASSGHDPGLKNLMMAWYWAGYYTRQAEEQLQR